eukprot:g11289.t1
MKFIFFSGLNLADNTLEPNKRVSPLPPLQYMLPETGRRRQTGWTTSIINISGEPAMSQCHMQEPRRKEREWPPAQGKNIFG